MFDISRQYHSNILDPRTALVVLFVIGSLFVFYISLYAECAYFALLFLLFFINSNVKSLLYFSLLFLFFAAFEVFLKTYAFNQEIAGLFYICRRFLLVIMAGKYALNSIVSGSLIASLEKMKMPYSFVIIVFIMFRFFPTLVEDFTNLKKAMRARNIYHGYQDFLIRPFQIIKNVITPLLYMSSRLADDLTVAGLVKGVDSRGRKKRYKEPSLKMFDYLVYAYLFAVIVFL